MERPDKVLWGFYIACVICVICIFICAQKTVEVDIATSEAEETLTVTPEPTVVPTVVTPVPTTVPKPTVTPEPTTTPTPTPEPVSLGEFILTAYCSCSICCGKYADNRPLDKDGNEIVYGASGERLFTDYSVAVDPEVIPLGTEIIYNGHTYKAVDTGSGVKGKWIDIYMTNHDQAKAFGMQKGEIFLKN